MPNESFIQTTYGPEVDKSRSCGRACHGTSVKTSDINGKQTNAPRLWPSPAFHPRPWGTHPLTEVQLHHWLIHPLKDSRDQGGHMAGLRLWKTEVGGVQRAQEGCRPRCQDIHGIWVGGGRKGLLFPRSPTVCPPESPQQLPGHLWGTLNTHRAILNALGQEDQRK